MAVKQASKKKKVRWMKSNVAVAVPSSRRQARRGTKPKPHRTPKRRSR